RRYGQAHRETARARRAGQRCRRRADQSGHRRRAARSSRCHAASARDAGRRCPDAGQSVRPSPRFVHATWRDHAGAAGAAAGYDAAPTRAGIIRVSEIDRFRPDDRRGVDTLYRRTHGADAANALRLRWDWQHRRNPYNQTGQPEIWVAREGPTVIGHYTTLPVRVSIKGIEVEGAWGSDAMVAPERRRQGIGEALVRTWDRHSGAVLSLGATADGRKLLDRLHWPDA